MWPVVSVRIYKLAPSSGSEREDGNGESRRLVLSYFVLDKSEVDVNSMFIVEMSAVANGPGSEPGRGRRGHAYGTRVMAAMFDLEMKMMVY